MKSNINNIKIGAVDYTVKMLPARHEEIYGSCVFQHQTIYLSPNMMHQQASDTLLHEVMHAIWIESGMDHIKDLDEEDIIRTMATWLRIVIANNPQFATFIVDASKLWKHKPLTNPDEVAIR